MEKVCQKDNQNRHFKTSIPNKPAVVAKGYHKFREFTVFYTSLQVKCAAKAALSSILFNIVMFLKLRVIVLRYCVIKRVTGASVGEDSNDGF